MIPNANTVFCPKCGSNNISFQLFQQEDGTTSVSHTKGKTKRSGHGLLWWLFIGWWYWAIDLLIWIFLFPIKLITHFSRSKKTKSTTVAQSVNQVSYKTMCLCNSCGNNWVKAETRANTGTNSIKKLKKKVEK